jgi:O-antigen/teichoic acid export membrane protein
VYVRRRIAVIALHVVIQVTLVLLETEVVLFLAANAFIAVMQYVVVAYPLPRVAWVGGFDFGVLRRALPLFFAAVAANLYLRIDTVMLTGLYGPTEAGIYSAAVQIAEIPGFLPIAIGATFFLDIRTAKGNPTQEQDVLTYTTALVTGTVGLAVIGLIVFGPFLLPLLLGEAFQESAKILVIYAPSMFFLGWGIIRHRWLVVNNLEYHSAIAAIIGLVVNVGLNLALIPSLGAVGATIATLVSYAMGMYGYSVVVPRCRPAAVAVHGSFARAPRAVLNLLKRDRTSVD